MAEIKTYAIPTWLYRYRPLGRKGPGGIWTSDPELIDRELSAIETGNIHCSVYRNLNDPMEGLYRASERVALRDDYDAFVEQVRNQKLQLGIASLSENWNHELMWAHYGGEFRGMCVGYSVSRLLAGLSPHCALSRVAYADRPYFLNLRGMKNQDERARAILSTKNSKWSYEREWRLFAPHNGPTNCGNEAVVCIYLGVRMAKPEKDRIRRRMRAIGIPVHATLVDGYAIKKARRRRVQEAY